VEVNKKEFLAITPYFDLRPFAWLTSKSWVALFNHIAPLLKNVQIFDVRGIGRNILHAKVKLPHVPVLSHGAHITKTIVKKFVEHVGVHTNSNQSEKNNRSIVFCISVISRISANLTTINCFNTSLTHEENNWIAKQLPRVHLNNKID
jgi:hypothetical protein